MPNIIVEGIELVGKSYLIKNLWDSIEKEFNSGQGILDGCTWLNTDVGLYGSQDGWELVNNYIQLATALPHRNIIFEKLHFTQHVYTGQRESSLFLSYDTLLKSLGFKVILLTVNNDENLILKRLNDRLQNNAPYQRIANKPSWYLEKQSEFLKVAKKSSLPVLIVDNSILPNDNYKKALEWINS